MFLLKICKALTQAKIEYAIVGGYAVALHGAIRGTIDVDIVISLTKTSFTNLEKVLKKLGLEPRLPVTADQIFDFREEYIKNKNLIAWSFFNPNDTGEQLDIIITEDAGKMKTKKVMLHGVPIQVASISDLIKMKTKSGRQQDLVDIKVLRELSKK